MKAISAPLARLRELTREAVSRLAFYPVVRLLEEELSGRAPIGGGASDEDERVHFVHPASFTLPAGDLVALDLTEQGGHAEATLSTSFLGLVGAQSPLPFGLSEAVIFEEDGAAAALYDVLHHRALSLLYLAWKRYTPSVAAASQQRDDYDDALLSLVGEDAFSPYTEVAEIDPMFTLGLSDFARCDPGFLDTGALEELLRRAYPELDVKVSPADPTLVRAADEDRSCLGVQRSTLGEDASYGSSALDPSGIIRLTLGPVDRAGYEALMPGGVRYRQMGPLLESWLSSRAVAELDVLVPAHLAPSFQLGDDYGSSLGGDAQYRAPDTQMVHARVLLSNDPHQQAVTYLDDAQVWHVEARERSGRELPRAPEDLRWTAALTLRGSAALPPAIQETLVIAAAVADAGRTDAALDLVIASLDEAIARQVDAILHDATFQAIEARWRGVDYAVRTIPSEANVKIALYDCSKEALIEDLEQATELVASQIFATTYTAELGTFGGEPYAAILADMELDASPRDLALLRRMNAIATMAHAPFFAAASPRLLQLRSWRDLPALRGVRALFESPSRVSWNTLRDSEDSRAGGLLVGRPLYRPPYTGDPADTRFTYAETVSSRGDELLFGSPIYPLASRLASSFARHGMLTAIAGSDTDSSPPPSRSSFAALGRQHLRAPLEVSISPRLEHELRDAGLMSLRHGSDGQLFFPSANSLQRPRTFGRHEGGREATINHVLGTKFSYFFVACRFAHYLKVLERELTGAHRSATEVEQTLNDWLAQYVLQMNAASAAMRARYPLRGGSVSVVEVDGAPGWYRGAILIRPHVRYLDRFFTLSVTSFIPQRAGAAMPAKFAEQSGE